MKRWIYCLCTSFALCGYARAQEDIQAMLKQIAKLEIYITQLEKGYSIAREGLTMISEIKKGEYNLHQIFFSSLQRVSPAVAEYSKIGEMIADQVRILNAFKELIKKLDGRSLQYVKSVYTAMIKSCGQQLDHLFDVTTDGKLAMPDDERIERIDDLWRDMKGKIAFATSFTNQVNAGLAQTQSMDAENQILKSLE